ncbi:MAG: amino acid permease [Candidatus Gastranaerophilales bacterium]|nr:amino acid permease [Candidatus Gastranaerophilales bacterium]
MEKPKSEFLSKILKRKNPEEFLQTAKKSNLKKTLGATDLIILGIGAVVGTGVFTLSGLAIAGEAAAGPSFIISLIIAAIACIFSAFCYAEFASLIPVAGSAYTYTFAVFGQFSAWIMGWVLMLEYAIGNIAVALALSSYWFEFMKGFQGILPDIITNKAYWVHHLSIFGYSLEVNILSMIFIAFISFLLYKGMEESKRMAEIMVIIKVGVILLFVIAGAFYVKPENWTPFMPSGMSGIFKGAFLIFFAYIGFDAVSTAAEETKNPQKNMPIAIIGTLLICSLIYIAVAAVLTGLFPFSAIVGNQDFIHAPIAYALNAINQNFLAMLVSMGAIAGLFSVLLVLQLAATRVLFAMSRDNLLPKVFSKIHPKFSTPYVITIATGIFTMIGTLVLDLKGSADLCNIGTFTAFIIVSIGVIILRYTNPNAERAFKIPLMPWIPLAGIACCLFIIYKGIPMDAFIAFAVWIACGVAIYFMYGYKYANLPEEAPVEVLTDEAQEEAALESIAD